MGALALARDPSGSDTMTVDPVKKKKMLSYRWAIFIVLAIAYFFVYFHRTTGGAISDGLQEYFGVGSASVALLASAYLYAYTLMQIPSGILTDSMGPRKAASIFIALIAVGSILSAYAARCDDFNLMIAGKFLIGIGAAVIYIPIMKILAVWYRRDEFASTTGILLIVGNAGAIAAATPMVLMMDTLGIEMTYIVLAIVTAAIALLAWILVRNHPSEKDFPSMEEIVSEETGKPISESTSSKMGTIEALKMTFTSGMNFWPLAIWFFIIYGCLMFWQASQCGSYYTNVYGWDKGTAGWMVTMVGIGMAAGSMLGGTLSDKVLHSRKKVLIFSTLTFTVMWAIVYFTAGELANVGIQLGINLFLGFFSGFLTVCFAQIKELFPVAMAGTATAALNVFPFAGGAILITIGGYIVQDKTLAEFETAWLMCLILMIVACVLAFMTRERKFED